MQPATGKHSQQMDHSRQDLPHLSQLHGINTGTWVDLSIQCLTAVKRVAHSTGSFHCLTDNPAAHQASSQSPVGLSILRPAPRLHSLVGYTHESCLSSKHTRCTRRFLVTVHQVTGSQLLDSIYIYIISGMGVIWR